MLLTMVLAVACGQLSDTGQLVFNGQLGVTGYYQFPIGDPDPAAPPVLTGVRVLSAERGKPGWSTGLRKGDVVTHVAYGSAIGLGQRKSLKYAPVTAENWGDVVPSFWPMSGKTILVVYRPALGRKGALALQFVGSPRPFPKPSTGPKP